MTPGVDLAHELAEARRQLGELESLVENSSVAIVLMDADQRVKGWNPAAARLFGYSPQEAVGRPIDDLVMNDDLREEGLDVTRQAREHGRADRITRRVRKDGKPQPAHEERTSSTAIGRAAGTVSSTGLSGARTTRGEASSGSQRAIGSSSRTSPSSTSSISAVAVIGLVSEAIRTIEPGSSSPVDATSESPPRATSAAAPGTTPSATAASSIA